MNWSAHATQARRMFQLGEGDQVLLFDDDAFNTAMHEHGCTTVKASRLHLTVLT
jgi:hypothetical protein